MQREIKKKTVTYGIAALMLTVVLTAAIYNFGQLSPMQPVFSELKTFSSLEELENFITTNTEIANNNQQLFQDKALVGERNEEQLAAPEAPTATLDGDLVDYSGTNIQVAGVDEADVVKTDGEYLYVVAESAIYILKAFPADQAVVLSKIDLNEAYGSQIYVRGNKLVVIVDHPYFLFAEPAIATSSEGTKDEPVESMLPPYIYTPEITVKVYDITNKASPVLSRTVTVNGSLSGTRMIGDYLYAVVNQRATQTNSDGTDEVNLPAVSGTHNKTVEPTEIYYIDVVDQVYFMTTVVAVDVTNDAAEPTIETFLTSQTTSMYVSTNNMYLIAPNTNNWLLLESADEAPEDETLVYRVKLDKQNMVVEAEGKVTGFVLNQFSMDEYNGYFRIATTEWDNKWTEEEGFTSNSTNSLFIMDMNLDVVGKLENLAVGESIYSTRFMGDRVYIVTFRQIDPFYVIDASNPTQPTVLGYLKIPGYSSYLHPYDETHIIGVGMENSTLKLSLFDVTNVNSPIEISKYIVDADYSSSNVLWDHKGFLFDKTKNLLALPVSTNFYDTIIEPRTDSGDEPMTPSVEPSIPTIDTDDEKPDEIIREPENGTNEVGGEVIEFNVDYWQGAYIFDVSVENGFSLKGTITHKTATDQYEYGLEVERILYIEDVIYTISDKMVKLHNLESLAFLKEIQLS